MKTLKMILKWIKQRFKPAPSAMFKGACHQCGKCCLNIILTDHNNKPINSMSGFKQLLKCHPEYKIFKFHHKDPDDGIFYFYCSCLGEDNLCTIHEQRPSICAQYPDPDMIRLGGELLPGCGYFLSDNTFATVLKKEISKIPLQHEDMSKKTVLNRSKSV